MKTQTPWKPLLIAACFMLSLKSSQANDLIFIDGFRMFASKSTLMVELGSYEGRFAIKMNFGYGLAAKNLGLVYQEGIGVDDSPKVAAAVEKLSQILNDPETTMLRIDKELSTDLGLTFQKSVKVTEIK